MNVAALIHILVAASLSPLLLGFINRVKAVAAGRRGQPILQTYYDIWKLFRKGWVLSRTVSPVFALGPAVNFAAMLVAAALIPFGSGDSLLSFPGDIFLLAYVIGLGRFFTVIAALDTGSSFEGMGASRESEFSILAEVAFVVALVALAVETKSYSVAAIFQSVSADLWFASGPALILVMVALFIVLIAESSRIPVDDPNTHLELTMIHEVMVLDHCGVDLALITVSSCLKFMIFATLFAGVAIPRSGLCPWLSSVTALAGVFSVSFFVGVLESSMARLKLLRVPEFLCVAVSLSTLALILALFMR